MKRLAVILPVLLSLCFVPEVRAANPYWGGSLGRSNLEFDNFQLKLNNAATYQRQSIDLKHGGSSAAFGAAFIYGLDFSWAGNIPLRLELEASLSDGGASSSKEGYYHTQGVPTLAEVKMQLQVDWFCFIGANLWLDIPVGGFPVKPYLGGGLGYNFISYNTDIIINPGAPTIEAAGGASGRDAAWLYKLGGGARLAVSKRAFLDLGLLYAKKQNWSINAAPFELEFSSRALEARIGLRYYF